jgi:hypothetical protein
MIAADAKDIDKCCKESWQCRPVYIVQTTKKRCVKQERSRMIYSAAHSARDATKGRGPNKARGG